MIADFQALAYLELKQLCNTIKHLVRQPGRLIMYGFILLYFGMMVFLRTRPHYIGAYHGIQEPLASAVGFGALALAAGGFLFAATGRVGAFTSLADARFLINSKLRERNVLLWLQLRSSWQTLARFLYLIILYALLYPKAGRPIGMLLGLSGLIALHSSLNISIARLCRIGFTSPVRKATLLLIWISVCAAIVEVSTFVTPKFTAISHALRAVGLGHITSALLAGDPRAITGLWTVAIALLATSFFGITDLYPELYAASSKVISARARRKQSFFARFAGGETSDAPISVSSPIASRLPRYSGAWTIVWKEWVTFARSGRLTLFTVLAIAAAAVGFGIGIYCAVTPAETRTAILVTVGGSVGNIALVLFSLSAGVSLAEDIRKPLWWISADSLRARLHASVVATSWRPIVLLTVSLAAWSIAMRNIAFGILSIPVSMVTILYVRCIGLALYAIFPAKLDQRGPVAMLRLLLCYVLMVPAIGAGIGAQLVLHQPLVSLVFALLVALLESAALIQFAALRIQTGGIAIAQAEDG
ncbi:MAG: putative ABC exporter domain-containing protein [Candidatus Eremiobacteraeota bacterium]|nr:putative ABC exporter domain-containing protein [Candidatus Eremiobacteraeota bacterium]